MCEKPSKWGDEMSISIQKVPYGSELAKLADSATTSLKITSPFITFKGIQYITNSNVIPKIITKVTASNLSSFALEGKALKHLLVLGAQIKSIPNLHAKVYLVDDNKGIITSSNLTASGFSKNVELGIYFENETQLFEATDRFFNKLWDQATWVTLTTLEHLEQQIKTIKYKNGIYRVDMIDEVEDIVPVPVIGQLVYNFEEGESSDKKNTNPMELDYEECDESGDYFAPLPTNIAPILDSLNSLDDRKIQTVINSLSLATKENFENWLADLLMSEFELLINISNPYPYKRYVIRKIIANGSILHLALLINTFVTDISNENQMLMYYDNLTKRMHELTKAEKEKFISSIIDTVNYLGLFVNKGQINEKKNFARPNLDKINNLLIICGKVNFDSIKNKHVDVVLNEKDVIPGFQEIKRKREALGEDFWNYAQQFFPAVGSGAWIDNLSSINSLFKELNKIKISNEHIQQIKILAIDTITSLNVVKDRVIQELIEEFNKLTMDKRISLSQNEQLQKAFQELKQSTGRLVQIYGQWTKEGQIIKDNNVKNKLDFLSTYYATLSTLKKWL